MVVNCLLICSVTLSVVTLSDQFFVSESLNPSFQRFVQKTDSFVTEISLIFF